MTKRKTAGLVGLAAALAEDREAAFPRLVRALQDGIYSGVLRLTADRAEAEDITQEAFLRAYRALGSYPPERVRELQVREWLWTIALNLCRNQARSRSRHPAASLTDDPALSAPGPGPEQAALAAADRERLAGHLVRLPWAMRASVVLRHVTGLPYTDIAAVLGRPVGTVKSDVRRGLQRLRRSMEEEP